MDNPEPFEVVYRRLSKSEAAKSITLGGLDKGNTKFLRNGQTHTSEPLKWLAKNLNWLLEYSPTGSSKEDYSHLLEVQVVPGTIDALSQWRLEGVVRKGPRSTYGVPFELVDWFNKRVLGLKAYDLKEGTPILTHHKQVPYYLAHKEGPVLFAAFDPQYLENNHFSNLFSQKRMTWLKTSLLWMLHRSNWGKSPGQERIVAIQVEDSYLKELSTQAVSSSASPYNKRDEQSPHVLYQRDPDRAILGVRWENRQENYWLRANTTLQLGVRQSAIKQFVEEISTGKINDITDIVQRIERDRLTHPTNELYTQLEYVKLPFPYLDQLKH